MGLNPFGHFLKLLFLSKAQHLVGLIYNFGVGASKNIEKAITWYHKAAAQGNAESLHKLCKISATGQDSIRDDIQGYISCNIAVTDHVADAKKHLKMIAERMTAGDIEKGHKLAQDWMAKHR